MRWLTGIDLGTANVRLADVGEGLRLDEPALIATRGESFLAAGDSAWRILGREPDGVSVASPLRDGVPDNPQSMRRLFSWLFNKSEGRRRYRSVIVSCAPFSRPAYSEALMQSALDAGASDVALVRSDIVSAVGSGVDVLGPQATLLIDVGAGKMTCTLFSFGREVAFGYLPYGMNKVNERIIAALKSDYGFKIGWRTAEDIKLSLATAHPGDVSTVKARAAGLDIYERLPKLAEVSPELILKICEDPLNELMGMCQAVISGAPEELAADLNDTGAVLAGGGAQISGLDKLIGDRLSIPCSIAEAPSLCGIRGINALLLEPDRYVNLIWQRMAIAQRG